MQTAKSGLWIPAKASQGAQHDAIFCSLVGKRSLPAYSCAFALRALLPIIGPNESASSTDCADLACRPEASKHRYTVADEATLERVLQESIIFDGARVRGPSCMVVESATRFQANAGAYGPHGGRNHHQADADYWERYNPGHRKIHDLRPR